MRSRPTVLHLDLDAFFAAVEQRDKPSLRGKPVIVGGIGQRGVVATASYEARVFGVRSAMPTHEARRRCPHAAFLSGRFGAYRRASGIVMAALRELSPLVEPLSLDEAFVDLEAGGQLPQSLHSGHPCDPRHPSHPRHPGESRDPTTWTDHDLLDVAQRLRATIAERTGGLTGSVGLGTSKFIAKVASELAKPDGVRLVPAGTEVELIAGLPARAIPGVGPVTMEKLSRLGVTTVADLQRLSPKELTRELGRAQGDWIGALAFARDDRPVEPEREAKSISVENTFETDVTDRHRLGGIIVADAAAVARRLAAAHLFARTITLKARYPDFTTLTRSRTLDGATDSADVIAAVATSLLDSVDVPRGLRLLGVGVAGLTELAQETLFEATVPTGSAGSPGGLPEADGGPPDGPSTPRGGTSAPPDGTSASPEGAPVSPVEPVEAGRRFAPGADVVHDEHGAGWVWGSGLGRVTVRFETAHTGPGPVRTFAVDDPELRPAES